MNAANILDDLLTNLKGALAGGFATIGDFVERDGGLLAKQAAHIAQSRATGSLAHDDELFQFLLDRLEQDTANMARSVALLTLLTIEMAWNAIAGALWGGIRGVLIGAGLPAPIIPALPPQA